MLVHNHPLSTEGGSFIKLTATRKPSKNARSAGGNFCMIKNYVYHDHVNNHIHLQNTLTMAMSHHKTPPPIAMEVKYSEDWWGIISS
jgi:hypothetical protein